LDCKWQKFIARSDRGLSLNVRHKIKWLDSKYDIGDFVSDPNKSDVENVCGELVHALQGVLSWQWDGRFETILAEFGVDNKENVRAILERCLSMIWDNSNIATAPDSVRRINVRVPLGRGSSFLPQIRTAMPLFFVPGGHGATVRPSLYASRHLTRNYQTQRRPRKFNVLKAGSECKYSP
jgi:hypothetical protein